MRRRQPLTRGDRAHAGEANRKRAMHDFKACTATKPLLLNINGLHYTQDGI